MTDAFLPDSDAPGPGLTGQRVEVSARGPVVPLDMAWGLLGDTDWLNRVAGNGAVVSMELAAQRDGLPVLTGELAGPAGLRFPFEEAWTAWSRGRWFRQVRTVRSPILVGTDYRALLRPAEGGVVPEVTLALHTTAWAAPVARLAAGQIRARWQRALSDLGRPVPALREVPAAARGSFERWRRGSEPVASRFEAWLVRARPTALSRIRAFALADAWGYDRGEVLEGFLEGVDAGAIELYWGVRCQRCYGNVAQASSLSDLPDHVDCGACRVSTGVDLGETVEVLFAPHPSVVSRVEERFCTLYPAGAPEQFGVYTLAPGQALEDVATLAPGLWRLGGAGAAGDLRLEAGSGPDELEWHPDLDRFSPDQAPRPVAAGPVRLHLRNDRDARTRVYLTREGGTEPIVQASLLSTRPAWQRRYGAQVLSPDLRLSARSVCLVFTDLSGSTAMYEELGDARAFAVVRDHFALLRKEVEAAGGVVVKTIGDAIMAAFHDPAAAMDSALSMQRAFATWVPGLALGRPLRLKVGLHLGPALAVHSEAGGLDWFGGTVNLAARAQGAAEGGQVVVTATMWELPEVRAVAERWRSPAEPMERELKGFAGTIRLVRLTVPEPGA